jgi:hypothetical protein
VDTVSAIERAVRSVAVEDLPVLCGALGLPLSRLLQDAEMADVRRLGLN